MKRPAWLTEGTPEARALEERWQRRGRDFMEWCVGPRSWLARSVQGWASPRGRRALLQMPLYIIAGFLIGQILLWALGW